MSQRVPPHRRPPTHRPRVSRQTYMVRRAVALGVLAIVLIGSVAAAKWALSDDTSAAAPDTTITANGSPVVADSTAAPTGDAATQTAAPTAAAPTTVEDTGPPSSTNKAKVYIAGDSDAGAFGPYLMDQLDATGIVTSTLDYKVSSGLARPDFFDWPAHLRQTLPEVDPDIVIVTFGGNDAQDMLIDGRSRGTTTPEWREEYGKRVGAVMDLLTEDGRTLIWVGIPNASGAEFTARLEPLRQVTEEQAAARAGKVVYIDTWNRFTGRNGGYAEYVVDPRDGQVKAVRADDGFHLNVTGAEILSLDIFTAIENELRARGAGI